MGILSKIYVCPNVDCINVQEGEKGQVCPECSTKYQKMTSFQANNLCNFKRQIRNEKLKRNEKENQKNVTKSTPSNIDVSNEKIKAEIYPDMENLLKEQIDIDWEEFEAELSSKSETMAIAIGLKAIIEQNKLIIRQNELIYRELKRINHQSDD